MAKKVVEGLSKGTTSERKSFVVKGGKILVFADTHFSISYEGKHKNYAYDCFENMTKILDIVKKEEPSAVIFLGDIIGVRERNIADRQFLMRVVLFFGMLFNITKGNVFVVRGNHDIGDFSDFDFIAGLGYFKNPRYVDYVTEKGTEIRFHFVNYGDEHLPLELAKDGVSNIVLGHADYYIEGVTTWYSEKKGRVELKTLNNFCGVELVFSGHIHTPSKEFMYTNMPDGEVIGLFYPGSCSRTAERYDDCWYVSFEYNRDEGVTQYDAKLMGLKKASEVFFDDADFVDDESAEDLVKKTEALNVIIEEIFNSRLATGDLFGQIDRIPAEQDVKDLAKEYLHRAMDEKKVG